MTKEKAMREAREYFERYGAKKWAMTGVPMKVRVVALMHDSMGNKYEEPSYVWHDYSDDVFAKNSWKDEPTVAIIQ